jgi:WD40 repeat protein
MSRILFLEDEIVFPKSSLARGIAAWFGASFIAVLVAAFSSLLVFVAAAVSYDLSSHPGFLNLVQFTVAWAICGPLLYFIAGTFIGMFRRNRRRGTLGSLLNLILCGQAQYVICRGKAKNNPALRIERRLPYGRVWLEDEIPLDHIGPIRMFRDQRCWGEFPSSSVVFGQGGHRHSLQITENAVSTEAVKTLRRWQRAAQGAPAGLMAELSFSPEGKTRLTSAAAFSPGVRLLASGGWDGMVRVRTWPDGNLIQTLAVSPTHAFALAVSPDGDRLVCHGFTGGVQLWGLADKMQLAALGEVGISAHNTVHGLQSVAFSPDGNTFALAGPKKQVSLWESTAGKQLGTFEQHREKVWSVAFSPDGRAIASGGRSVLLWEASSRKVIRVLKGHAAAVNSLGISPDGKTIASASWDGTIRLWSVSDGKLLGSIDCGSKGFIATPLALSCDGKMLAWGDAGVWGGVGVRLWNIPEGKPLATFDGHCSHILAVAFATDGKTLVSAAHDDTVIAWRIPE